MCHLYRFAKFAPLVRCGPLVNVNISSHKIPCFYFHLVRNRKRLYLLYSLPILQVFPPGLIFFHFYLQVAYGASSFYLSDKKKYPLFFRTIPPEKGQNRVRLAVLQHFKWNRIAILTEKEPYYEAVSNYMKRTLINLQNSSSYRGAILWNSVSMYFMGPSSSWVFYRNVKKKDNYIKELDFRAQPVQSLPGSRSLNRH